MTLGRVRTVKGHFLFDFIDVLHYIDYIIISGVLTMNAVMYGGGNIGRGFIGALLSKSGYRVTFIDVSEPVVTALSRDGRYPLRYVSAAGQTDEWIENVTAIDGNDTDAVARAIADCDIMATSVGARVLPYIAPNIAAGFRLRGKKPLNILICENLMDADRVLGGLIKEHLCDEECAEFDNSVGLIETSIGRMVPVQTEEMKDGEPMRVCVEKYGYLPVDRAAFKGGVPDIKGMVPFSPFDYYIKRKLFLHNMGHAVCAYLGSLAGYKYISQAINDPYIYIAVQNAMLDSGAALSKKYDVPLCDILTHNADLLFRFANPALGDTCERVGADPARKLGAADRLIGASLLCMEQGIDPTYIALGAAGALLSHGSDDPRAALSDLSGLAADHPLCDMILHFYKMQKNGADTRELLNEAQSIKAQSTGDVI